MDYPDEKEKLVSAVSPAGYQLVLRKMIPGILAEEFYRSAWNQWCRWKRFGLPHGADGWMRENALWVSCMEIIEEEHAAYQHDRTQKRRRD